MARGTQIKGVKGVLRNVKKTFTNTQKSLSMYKKIEKFTLDRIQAFTRSGKSIVTGKKLKGLAESTIKQRRRRSGEAEKKFFNPDRSNLTMTGQMINSLKAVIDKNKHTLSVFANRRMRKRSRIIKEKSKTNEQVAGFAADGGRSFIGMDKKGSARIKRIVLDELRRQIRRI